MLNLLFTLILDTSYYFSKVIRLHKKNFLLDFLIINFLSIACHSFFRAHKAFSSAIKLTFILDVYADYSFQYGLNFYLSFRLILKDKFDI